MLKTSCLVLKAHETPDVHRLFYCCHSDVTRKEAADKQEQRPGAAMHYHMGSV